MTTIKETSRRVLACGKGACCPTLVVNEDKSTTLIDDDGKTIKLNPEQSRLLKAELNEKI